MYLRSFEDLHRWDGQRFVESSFNYDLSGRSVKSSPISGNFTVMDGPSQLQVPGNLDGNEALGDVIGVNLTKGVTYSFALRPTETGGIIDPLMALFDPSGENVLVLDDDGGAGRSSIITFTPKQSGQYLLLAGSWVNIFSTGGDTGDYTIDIWTTSPKTSTDTPDTFAGAKSIGEGTTFGHTETSSDIDMYKIDLSAGLFYEFGVSGGATTAMVELIDADGNILVSHSAGESGVGWDVTESGSYFVRITPTDGTAGGYTLDVNSFVLADRNPVEALNWDSADNIRLFDTDGDGVGDTAYVYFAAAGENFGETQGDGGADGVAGTADDALVSLGWNAYEKQQVMAMLEEYSDILGINYEITTDATNATFRLITTNDEPYGARFYPHDVATYGTQIGIGTFNKDSHAWTFDQQQSLERGGFAWELLLHEFGHAHGIAHPHDNGGGSEIMPGVFTSQDSFGAYNLNQSVYTVMSYNSTWHTSPYGPTPFAISSVDSGSVGEPSPFDIATLEFRYGPLPERNLGDDVYELTDVQDDALFQTVWDHGGNDTIAYSGSRNLGAVIDLTAATLDYSPTGGGVMSYLVNPTGPLGAPLPNSQTVRGGFLIAGGVEIENATGGGGNDMLLGNALDNVLTGNAGDDVLMGRAGTDTLNGGDGSDTAAYNDAASAVVVDIDAQTATGGDGSDALSSIENAIGSAHNDTLTGDEGANTLDGNLGDDALDGAGGTNDTVSYATATSRVSVSLLLQGGSQNTLGAGSDTLNGFENLTGSRFDDKLIGNNDVNKIKTGDGVDVVKLGGGNDFFIAELATAKTQLKTGSMSVDIVTDFDQSGSNDKIDFSGIGDFAFKGTASNKGAGTVWYKTYTSVNGAESALGIEIDGRDGAGGIGGPVTVVYADHNGGGADVAVILLNQSSVDANDFILS